MSSALEQLPRLARCGNHSPPRTSSATDLTGHRDCAHARGRTHEGASAMTHVRRFWLVVTGLAMACGGRTMVGGEEPGGDGGVAEDAPRLDAPIVGEDGP